MIIKLIPIISLTHQNGLPSNGYKSISLSLEAIPRRSQCEIQRYLLTRFGAQRLMWQAGEKAQVVFRSGSIYFSTMGIQVACSLVVSWYNPCFSPLVEFNQCFLQESGFPKRLPDVLDQQKYFDGLVNATKCTGASDRLACLRAVPYAQLMAAVNLSPNFLSYQGLNTVWGPMVDGKLFRSNPLKLLQSGKYAKVLPTGFFT